MPTTSNNFPQWFLDKLNSVQAKRARTVIQHILEHGHITTEDLKNKYGYNHPPRAARDVREEGIALETIRVKDGTGRSIGAYRFASPSESRGRILSGRKLLSKSLKSEVVERDGSVCATAIEAPLTCSALKRGLCACQGGATGRHPRG